MKKLTYKLTTPIWKWLYIQPSIRITIFFNYNYSKN